VIEWQLMQRTFTPYELTQLARAKINPTKIDESDTRPVEYITGVVEFCGLNFTVNPDVLIPRIESEWLVQRAADLIKDLIEKSVNSNKTKIRVLDMGTGSGAIIICLADQFKKESEKLEFLATEISASALNVARINAKNILGPDHRIRFVASDLFNQIQDEKPFDIIITNLPYIPKERIEYLDSSVKDHEPRVALDGGGSGFELIEKMLNRADEFITDNGAIILEIDHTHIGDVWQKTSKKWQVTLELDEFTRNRFAVLRPLLYD